MASSAGDLLRNRVDSVRFLRAVRRPVAPGFDDFHGHNRWTNASRFHPRHTRTVCKPKGKTIRQFFGSNSFYGIVFLQYKMKRNLFLRQKFFSDHKKYGFSYTIDLPRSNSFLGECVGDIRKTLDAAQ